MNIFYKKNKFLALVLVLFFCFHARSQDGRLPTKQEFDTKMALQELYKNPSFSSNKGNPTYKITSLPEQDCDNAIAVCAQSYTQATSYSGWGSQEVFGTCLSSQEKNSVWYVFTVQNSGTFTFLLNTANDYDFAM